MASFGPAREMAAALSAEGYVVVRRAVDASACAGVRAEAMNGVDGWVSDAKDALRRLLVNQGVAVEARHGHEETHPPFLVFDALRHPHSVYIRTTKFSYVA